jgi:hypothetical protein
LSKYFANWKQKQELTFVIFQSQPESNEQLSPQPSHFIPLRGLEDITYETMTERKEQAVGHDPPCPNWDRQISSEIGQSENKTV